MICRRSWSLLLLISSLGLVGQQCKSITLQTEANDVAEQAVPPEIKNKIAPAETIRQEPEKTAGKSPTLPVRHLELKKVLTGQQGASLSVLNLFVRPSCLLEGRTGYFDPGAQRIILAEPGFADRPKLRAMSWGTQHNFKSRSYRLHGDCSGQVGFEKLGFLSGTNHLLAISCRQLLLFDATTLELYWTRSNLRCRSPVTAPKWPSPARAKSQF